MSGRRVQRRTVAAYISHARYQLERAALAAVRCPEVSEKDWSTLRVAWASVDRLAQAVARRPSSKSKRP